MRHVNGEAGRGKRILKTTVAWRQNCRLIRSSSRTKWKRKRIATIGHAFSENERSVRPTVDRPPITAQCYLKTFRKNNNSFHASRLTKTFCRVAAAVLGCGLACLLHCKIRKTATKFMHIFLERRKPYFRPSWGRNPGFSSLKEQSP